MSQETPPQIEDQPENQPEDVRALIVVLGVLLFCILAGMVILALSVAVDWHSN